MSLLDKLATSSTVKQSATMSESDFFNLSEENIPTAVPVINIAFSGQVSAGFTSGLTMIAGPSKHFKSNLGLACVSAYLKKYPDAICLYYDSEFGAPLAYFDAFGIDTDRVLHTPVQHVEELKFDMARQLENITPEDKVIVFIDSLGNLASKKELTDALEQNQSADMSRAAAIKSLWRICTPQLSSKDVPCVMINHTYDDITGGPYAGQVVAGGKGSYYSADTVWIVGRAQEKEDRNVVGYNFTITVDKSRFVAEKSKFKFQVSFKSGIDQWSGLFDLAWDFGYIKMPTKGYYSRILADGQEDKKWRKKATSCKDFWAPLLDSDQSNFLSDVYQHYALESTSMFEDDEPDEDDED